MWPSKKVKTNKYIYIYIYINKQTKQVKTSNTSVVLLIVEFGVLGKGKIINKEMIARNHSSKYVFCRKYISWKSYVEALGTDWLLILGVMSIKLLLVFSAFRTYFSGRGYRHLHFFPKHSFWGI